MVRQMDSIFWVHDSMFLSFSLYVFFMVVLQESSPKNVSKPGQLKYIKMKEMLVMAMQEVYRLKR
jgi:hypothetical protein